MIVKLKTLVESVESLNLAYKSSKIFRNINDEVSNFYQMRDNLIVEKYGAKNEDGTYNIAPERIEEYKSELKLLLDKDINLEGCVKISIEDIGDEKVTSQIIMTLG